MSATLPSARRAPARASSADIPRRREFLTLHLFVEAQFLGEVLVKPSVTEPGAYPSNEASHRELLRSGGFQDALNGADEPLELLLLGLQMFATSRGERVIPRAAVVVGGGPFGRDLLVQ